ncbi:transcriptional regulator PpsR [Phenylobacterium sp.]|uniref:transcriptional regulator PpsR n=1 Tax=Phenylobacterium sp. TaxID=1871053 RepID=UPI0025F6E499|nr:transcriptional regulator PpsR [Phenylobacterium sp.]
MTLLLDRNDVITDVTVSNTVAGEFVKTWLGRPWIETVADSGVEKVRRSLDDARLGGLSAYRQILQRFPSGLELPIEYTTVRLGDGAGLMAIGRNLQASSELQSRLLAAQEAMERDYWKLREVETRYRLLFDASNEAVLVLGSDDMRVVEANPAAIRALGLTRGWEFLNEMAPREREPFRAMLARVRESGRAPGSVFHIGAQQAPWILRASLMNDDATSFYMIQLAPVGQGAVAVAPPEPVEVNGILHCMPDGFVVLDRDGRVQSANQAFLELIQVDVESAVVGRSLDRWMRQPGADFAALLADVRHQGRVRAYATTLQGERGRSIAVEVSAGADAGGPSGFIGVSLRETGSRPALALSGGAQPQLPALAAAGQSPLKSLVQAAVEVVERHYVESALQITDGNRTAAAERLGLSRQSLYAKLNRYGLDGGSDATSPSSD